MRIKSSAESIAKLNRAQYQPSIKRVAAEEANVLAEDYGANAVNTAKLAKNLESYQNWHWGEKAKYFVDWQDDDYPEYLCEVGRLVRIHFRSVRPYTEKALHPRRQRDHMIELSRKMASTSYLVFDKEHHSQRLYMLINPEACPIIAERFWQENPLKAMPLGELAVAAGGKHAKGGGKDYPNIIVKPVGLMTAVVYHTHKRDDGPSYYIHHLGEKTCHFPILACDELGRLWFAGGDYTCPVEGIDN